MPVELHMWAWVDSDFTFRRCICCWMFTGMALVVVSATVSVIAAQHRGAVATSVPDLAAGSVPATVLSPNTAEQGLARGLARRRS